MSAALAFPFHDPDGSMFPHLRAILPDLKLHFDCAYISPPPGTLANRENMRLLEADPFFIIFRQETEMQIGERFGYLYTRAADAAPAEQNLHLCYLDRLSFGLETGYRDCMLADLDAIGPEDAPMIFQRSDKAWDTHPKNYREIETMVTVAGRHLFGLELDFAWCHLVVKAGQLRRIMPLVRNPGLSMVAEMVYYLKEEISTRAVDWLAWEDPYILGRDPAELKGERENDPKETQKRLGYALPMLETLLRFSEQK